MYKWNVEQALAMIARERINGLTLVPALAWQLADALAGSGGDVSSVDAVGYGGAAAAPDLAPVMRRTFPNALPGQGQCDPETTPLVAAHRERESAVSGKSGDVRVDLGGGGLIKKKKQ